MGRVRVNGCGIGLGAPDGDHVFGEGWCDSRRFVPAAEAAGADNNARIGEHETGKWSGHCRRTAADGGRRMIGMQVDCIETRLVRDRARLFVGRERERRLFRLLLRPEGDLRVLFVHGPGGVGKTTLLHEFDREASERGVVVLRVNAGALPSTPGAIRQSCAPIAHQAGDVRLLLVDGFDALAPLESWVRDEFLPRLPQDCRAVFCSRAAPSAQWRADPGWAAMLATAELQPFSTAESAVYLQRRGVDASRRRQVLAFAHGYPLALGLAADVLARQPCAMLPPEAEAEILRELMVRLLGGIDEPDRLRALRAAAIVRELSEPLLAHMLGRDRVGLLFDWLRGLSFVHAAPRGLVLHDLLRDAITDDLRRRHRDLYERMIARAYLFLVQRMAAGSLAEREQCALDVFFVQRDTPLVRTIYRFEHERLCYCDVAGSNDWPLVRDMVLRHEGEESLRYLEYWYRRQPEGLVAVRDASRTLTGFLFMLDLNRIGDEEAAIDPIVRRFRNYLGRRPALAPGERATLFRSWMGANEYQALSPVQTQVCAYILCHTLTTPDLAYVLHLQPDVEAWTRVSAQCGHTRLPGPPAKVGDWPNALYAHDYRLETPLEWIRGLHRELREIPGPAGEPALDRDVFEQAVRRALRDYVRLDRLADNPLTACAMVQEAVGAVPECRGRALQDLLRRHCQRLQAPPKTQPLYRVLHRTYLDPARNQALAAEALYLSERTYRRRLADAVKAVTASLWAAENGLP